MSLPEPVQKVIDELSQLTGDSEAANLAAKAISYAKSVENGEMSADEAADLMADLKVEQMVVDESNLLCDKIALINGVKALISLVSLIPIP